ncbi:MAG: H-NS histone family protein [Pseudomonadota bacterium]
MVKLNLEKLSYAELSQLSEDVEVALFESRKKNRKAALAAAREAAAKHGFSLPELIGDGRKSGSKAPTSAAKYVHPENPEKTWTGKGRQPGWIKDGLAAGKSLDDFAIG